MADADAVHSSILNGAALFLDFDGTLVELAETPASINVPAKLGHLLGALSEKLEGRVAIVSGRAIRDLQDHLDCSGVAIAGSHGLELLMPDGRRLCPEVPERLAAARSELAAFAASTPGILIEDKPFGVAAHYRQAPAEEAKVVALVRDLAARTGMSLQRGKMVAELRPGGAHKGDAVRALMREPVFAGGRPIFVGDDLTDEDAFSAAADLGGGGVLVGPARATVARWRLRDVAAVARWLNDFAEQGQ
ncbi:trehalose-phosphatase [Sphingosinicella rhizophila]|uniref:Trehalose 6-phosphate phosphatase n=1 Tax=Sphingosinicella rhizophila TaxID=3050082 RepID=A0ABU3Q1Y3_9SPHN|nr:trehalose-phosphatase [Sphingosinicella sp. GR2756]MDT9597431.1 trehalose-phosphatase [Sphingosinicella sp. GR2756]